MKHLVVLCAPPGAGKSTLAAEFVQQGYTRVNQDEQRNFHLELFTVALERGENIVLDRMNFNKQQRARYLEPAKALGYHTKIIVLHEPRETCFTRCAERTGHLTVKTSEDASRAINFFFSKYERPTKDEADEVEYRYPKGDKPSVLISDLDGTLCDTSKREHFVKREGKKDWASFFANIEFDDICHPVANVIKNSNLPLVYCSGRPDNFKDVTLRWLAKHEMEIHEHLFMRPRNDMRSDAIIKEIILDFEILTRYTPYLVLDDRDQVVKKWRERGIKCFQVAPGDF